MKRQRPFIWCGGNPQAVEGCQPLADALPDFAAPVPLSRAALIEYHWGAQRFQILATACAIRTTWWGGERVTWLHCKARQIVATKPDEPATLMTVLFPAHYVTAIQSGPTFRVMQSRPSDDLGIFPPNQPAPENALPLAEVERVIKQLLAAERN